MDHDGLMYISHAGNTFQNGKRISLLIRFIHDAVNLTVLGELIDTINVFAKCNRSIYILQKWIQMKNKMQIFCAIFFPLYFISWHQCHRHQQQQQHINNTGESACLLFSATMAVEMSTRHHKRVHYSLNEQRRTS